MPGLSGPTNTLTVPPGTTIFSAFRSLLSNSAGVASPLVISTLKRLPDGTVSVSGWKR